MVRSFSSLLMVGFAAAAPRPNMDVHDRPHDKGMMNSIHEAMSYSQGSMQSMQSMGASMMDTEGEANGMETMHGGDMSMSMSMSGNMDAMVLDYCNAEFDAMAIAQIERAAATLALTGIDISDDALPEDLEATPLSAPYAQACIVALGPSPGPTPAAMPMECSCHLGSVSFALTGGDCSATTNQQEGRAVCVDTGANGTATAILAADPEDFEIVNSTIYASGKLPANSDIVVVDANGQTIQTLTVHTSCSKPISTGDVFGALTVESFTCGDGESSSMSSSMSTEQTIEDFLEESLMRGKNLINNCLYILETRPIICALYPNATLTEAAEFGRCICNAPESSPLEIMISGMAIDAAGVKLPYCDAVLNDAILSGSQSVGDDIDGAIEACLAADPSLVEVEPSATPLPTPVEITDLRTDVCDCRPSTVVFEFTGGNCSASSNMQGDKFACVDLASVSSFSGNVSVALTGNGDDVELEINDDGIKVYSMNDGKLDAETSLVVSVGGVAVQNLEIHTSCSRPLGGGDVYGALTVAGFSCPSSGSYGGSMSMSMSNNYDSSSPTWAYDDAGISFEEFQEYVNHIAEGKTSLTKCASSDAGFAAIEAYKNSLDADSPIADFLACYVTGPPTPTPSPSPIVLVEQYSPFEQVPATSLPSLGPELSYFTCSAQPCGGMPATLIENDENGPCFTVEGGGNCDPLCVTFGGNEVCSPPMPCGCCPDVCAVSPLPVHLGVVVRYVEPPRVCECRPVSMTFVYEGGSCDDTTHYQEGKLTCDGPDVNGLATIECDNGANFASVSPGDSISLVGDSGKLDAQTTCTITGDGSSTGQVISIHTSCSKLLRTQDKYGALRVADWQCQGSTSAVVNVPDSDLCNCRPQCIEVSYSGGACDATTQDQEGRFLCDGGALGDNVTVSTSATTRGSLMGLSVGSSFGIGCQGDRVDANTDLVLTDASGNSQTMTLHTSCSKRLAVGDVFGALEITSFDCADDSSSGGGGGMNYDSMSGMNYDNDGTTSEPEAMVEVRFFREGVLMGSETVTVAPGGGVATCPTQPTSLATYDANAPPAPSGVSNMEIFPFALEDDAVAGIATTRQCVLAKDCIIPPLAMRQMLTYVPPTNPNECGRYEGCDVDMACTLDPSLVNQTINGTTYVAWTVDCVKGCYCTFDPDTCYDEYLNPSGTTPWCESGSHWQADGTPCCDEKCYCHYQHDVSLSFQCPTDFDLLPYVEPVYAMFYDEPTDNQTEALQEKCCELAADTCNEVMDLYAQDPEKDLVDHCATLEAIPFLQVLLQQQGPLPTDAGIQEYMAEACCQPEYPVEDFDAVISSSGSIVPPFVQCDQAYDKECCCQTPNYGCNYEVSDCAVSGGTLPTCDVTPGASSFGCCDYRCFCSPHFDSSLGGQYTCDSGYELSELSDSIPFTPVENPSDGDKTLATGICCVAVSPSPPASPSYSPTNSPTPSPSPSTSASPSPSPSTSASPSPSPSTSASPSPSPSIVPFYQVEINFASGQCTSENCIEVNEWDKYSIAFNVKLQRAFASETAPDGTPIFGYGRDAIVNIPVAEWQYFDINGVKIYGEVRQECWDPLNSEFCAGSIALYQGLAQATLDYLPTIYGSDNIYDWPSLDQSKPISYYCNALERDQYCDITTFIPTFLVTPDGDDYSPAIYDAGVYPNSGIEDPQYESEAVSGVIDCRVVNEGYWVNNVSIVTSKYVAVHNQPRSPDNIPGPCHEFNGEILCPAMGVRSSVITFGENTQDIDGNHLDLIYVSEEIPEFVPRYNVFNCPSGSTTKEMKESF